jgi:uncharacterized membrane protein HdeD (DUF308 family)
MSEGMAANDRGPAVMSMIDAKLIFTVLGPLFLLLGVARCALAGGLVPQGKTWLLIGGIFSAVALWLWR